MKNEFIPTPFTESSGECKICEARKEWERLLIEESSLLLAFGERHFTGAVSASLVTTYLHLRECMGDALADYRTCFAQNLALYYTVEVPGRLRREPGFLQACDQYRDRALESLAEFTTAFERFQVAASGLDGMEEISNTHAAAVASASTFWSEMATWTDNRYVKARTIFGSNGQS